tara:strand:+ start:74 stop:412 length:339 start_codon:yes stop_codon:yes gene_type:complete
MSRLKREVWVKAQLKVCDKLFISAVIIQKGDPESGSIIIRLNKDYLTCSLYKPINSINSEQEWIKVGGSELVENSIADEYIKKEISRDQDIWVLEIDDFALKFEELLLKGKY